MRPDWRQFVQQRLESEAAVQEELAEQLEEIYAAALTEGAAEPAARRLAENHIADWPALARAIAVSRAPLQARLPWRVRLLLSLAGLGRDLRQSGRSLRHARGFTLAAIATLGLGIGLCLALFSLTDALVLRPLPVPQPQRLMALLETSRQFPQMAVDWPDFQDWQADSRSFSQMAAVRGTLQILAHYGPSTTVSGLRITPGYFSILGARPALGRLLRPSDDRPGAADVVVVSWEFFKTRLAGDRAWLGRQLDLDGRLRTVIGVTPAGFPGLNPGSEPQIWEPLAPFIERNPEQKKRGSHNGTFVLARLRPGVTPAQARAEMAVEMQALGHQYPATNTGVAATLQPLNAFLRGNFSSTLLLLLAAGGLVLVIACLNVVNLFLARTVQRARDLEVRLALGAGRGRVFRAHFSECLWISCGGGLVGLVLAAFALSAITPLLPDFGLPAGHLALDSRALGLAALAVVGCALLCGLATLAQLRHGRVPGRVHGQGHAPASPRGRAGQALITVEMAGSVVLLIAASLVLHSLVRLQNVDYGFQPRGVFSFIVGLSAHYSDRAGRARFFRDSEQRLAQLPGVIAAGGVFPMPLAGYQIEEPFLVNGRPRPQAGLEPAADLIAVRGDYLAAMRIPLLAGRALNSNDTEHATPVALVDEVLARRYLDVRGELHAALGRRINLEGATRTVVGVVGHVQDRGLSGRRAAEIYIPQEQSPVFGAMAYVLRVAGGNPNQLRAPALAVIAGLDPDLAATDIADLSQTAAGDLAPRRAAAGVLAACAMVALLLACLGIYGMISFLVARRTHEIGIRMALGADRRRVLAVVLRQGLVLAAVGAVIGVGLATQLGRGLGALLYDVHPLDPTTFLVAPIVLLLAAVLACLRPALRATAVDPLEALRME